MNERDVLVGDLMTIDPVLIAADAPIEDAAHLCAEKGISGLPVVDGAGMLVGVISQTDLVRIQDFHLGRIIRSEPSGVRVGEVMTSPAVTVPMTATLREAARRMRDGGIHRLVVLDDPGQPVGVLSSFDLVAQFADS